MFSGKTGDKQNGEILAHFADTGREKTFVLRRASTSLRADPLACGAAGTPLPYPLRAFTHTLTHPHTLFTLSVLSGRRPYLRRSIAFTAASAAILTARLGSVRPARIRGRSEGAPI